MNVGSRSVTANIFFAGFTSPVDIDEDEKEFITAAAEQLGCKLSDSFFELGNLNKGSSVEIDREVIDAKEVNEKKVSTKSKDGQCN